MTEALSREVGVLKEQMSKIEQQNNTLKEELKEFVLNRASALELKREAVRLGMQTLRQSALTKVAEGQTTLGETFRISTMDH